jgi:hypothetical protein
MKATKPSRAELIRQHIKANPNESVADIAKKFKTTYQVVYTVKRGMQPKKVTVSASEVIAAQKAGVSVEEFAKKKIKAKAKAKRGRKPKLIKDTVTGLTPQQNFELAYAVTSSKSLTTMIKEAEDARKELSIVMLEPASDPVNHPAHYKVGGIETIDFIEAKKLNYNLGNAVKYITRADHKGNRKQDLEKAMWYLKREIETNQGA